LLTQSLRAQRGNPGYTYYLRRKYIDLEVNSFLFIS
jgi:hypothetical protein